MRWRPCQWGGRYLDKLSFAGTFLSLMAMLLLSALGICSRWGGVSWLWIDPLVRHLVLVTAFFGGALAVGRKAHIRIDILAKPLERLPRAWSCFGERLATLGALCVTTALTWSAWSFYLVEREFNGTGAMFIVILPVGWGLVTIRWGLALGEAFEPKDRR